MRAALNAEIISIAQKNGDLEKATIEMKTRRGFPPDFDYSVKDNSWIASLLYCFLVVPKELFDKHGKNEIFNTDEIKRMVELFTIIRGTNEHRKDPMAFIRALRNSVAHVHFTCDEGLNFTFKDKKATVDSFHFEATISKENLLTFLAYYGAFMADATLKLRMEHSWQIRH